MSKKTTSRVKSKPAARRSASRRKRASKTAPKEGTRVILEIKGEAAGEKGSEFHLSIGNKAAEGQEKQKPLKL